MRKVTTFKRLDIDPVWLIPPNFWTHPVDVESAENDVANHHTATAETKAMQGIMT